MRMSPADLLTLARFLLTPLILLYFLQEDYHTAFILFLVAGATDLIDGSIARLLKRQTRFGAVLDPIADKLLMGVTFVCLWVAHVVPIWFLLLVVTRDLMIVGGLAYLKIRKIVVPLSPTMTSKYATLCQLATAMFGILNFIKPGTTWIWPLEFYLTFFMALATLLILISWFQYGKRGMRILREPIKI